MRTLTSSLLVLGLSLSTFTACGGKAFSDVGAGDGGTSSSSHGTSGSSGGSSGTSTSASSTSTVSSGSSTSTGSSGTSTGTSGSGTSTSESSTGTSGSGSGSCGFSTGSTVEYPTNHRPNDALCLTTPPAGNCPANQGGPAMCASDSQCPGTNGRCIESMGGVAGCFCTADGCQQDTDCATGQLCVCHDSAFVGASGNTCMPGNCRVDSDCASGFCSPSHGGTTSCGGVTGYYCHTCSDACVNDDDCQNGQVCGYSSANGGGWQCLPDVACP